jgi:chromate transporter
VTSAPDHPVPPPERVPLGVVLREWGRIGLIGFGGPPAHVALLRELTVERRGWVGAREFEDANAATQLLPGPGSTQMAIFLAHVVAGRRGALVGGMAFILPGLVLTLALAGVALAQRPAAWIAGIGAGASAAVVPVIAHAGVGLARGSLAGRRGGALARAVAYALAAAAATVAVGPWVVLALLGAGGLELGWRRRPRGSAGVYAWPVAAALAVTGAAALPALAWTAFKVGALSYGGGFVIVPLMQGDAVDLHQWMTPEQFANAVAYGQLTPGPVTHTVAFVGWAAAGFGGALLASAIAFAPSFAAVLFGGRYFEALRESPGARAFLDGAGPAAVGAVLGAAIPLLDALGVWWQWALLAAAALVLARGRPAIVALLGGAAAGLAAALAGAPLP